MIRRAREIVAGVRSTRSAVLAVVAAVAACGVVAALVRPMPVAAGQDQLAHREWAKDAKPAGSKSCEKCHPEHFQRWEDSAHSRMVRLPAPDTVLGDFSRDNTLQWKGYAYRMFGRDGKYFVTVRPASGESTTYTVDYVIGSRRIQGYMSRLKDGRMYLLPVYWQIAAQAWFDSSLITPHTDEGLGVKQYWNTNCLACHATDLRFGFDPKKSEYSTKWVELAIGCEACHNPGSKHNDFFEKKPLRDYVRTEFNDTYISNQRYFDAERSTELCASCHGTKINYFLGYWPGDRAYDYFVPMVASTDNHDQQGDFYPDGRPTRFNHFVEFLGSECYVQGKATCISCHEGHSSENESLLRVPKEQSNLLCLNCHQEKYGGAKLTAHTFHLPDSPGSRCYECHMGEVLERLMMHRKDHSLDNPVPENTIKYGIPNTCNKSGCHGDRSAEWAVRTLDQWYGSQNRQKVLYAADAMWRAKKKDPTAIPMLVRAMADPNLRLNQRASAIEALRHEFGPSAREAIPALERLLSSGEPLIRVSAAAALGQIGDMSVATRVAMLLNDPERVVRITAAGALLGLQVVSFDGPANAAYTRVKQEYVDALQSWPNVPEFRVMLGNFHLLNKQFQPAIDEYQTAIQINPDMRDAWYFLGVGYAMSGKQSKALDALHKAKSLGPDAEYIDKMIATVEHGRQR